MTSTFEAPIGELHVVQDESNADKPTIVFLHDSLGCVELWRDFPKQLGDATHCNVMIYDRQGYGKSGPFSASERKNNYLEVEADVLNQLLNQYGVTKAILFGHSDGAL